MTGEESQDIRPYYRVGYCKYNNKYKSTQKKTVLKLNAETRPATRETENPANMDKTVQGKNLVNFYMKTKRSLRKLFLNPQTKYFSWKRSLNKKMINLKSWKKKLKV